MQQRLGVLNDYTKNRWGVHEILQALIRQDNKQRFLIIGAEFPLWVRAARGHNSKLELDDKDIAVQWLTLVSAEAGPLAPYKGRPCIPVEEIPPKLYRSPLWVT